MSILPASTYESALIAVRAEIIRQTGLRSEFVLNGHSLYGPDLLKTINQTIEIAPEIRDCFIVFEFREIENDSYGAGPINDMKMEALAPYGFFCKVYGDKCHYYAQKLLTIFKYPDTVLKLRAAGCHITSIHNIGSVNEFINNVLWPRCDIEIDMICRFEFDLIPDPLITSAESLTLPINIIREGE